MTKVKKDSFKAVANVVDYYELETLEFLEPVKAGKCETTRGIFIVHCIFFDRVYARAYIPQAVTNNEFYYTKVI